MKKSSPQCPWLARWDSRVPRLAVKMAGGMAVKMAGGMAVKMAGWMAVLWAACWAATRNDQRTSW